MKKRGNITTKNGDKRVTNNTLEILRNRRAALEELQRFKGNNERKIPVSLYLTKKLYGEGPSGQRHSILAMKICWKGTNYSRLKLHTRKASEADIFFVIGP